MKRSVELATGAVLGVVLLFLFLAHDAAALPAFARKYETSCATCHSVFPKLTAFGEAFRRNGYQFPEGADVEYTKQEPISMGSEAYKRVFPNAIWPGAIPARPPISVTVESEAQYLPEAADGEPKLDFNDTAGEVGFHIAGTAGENISYWWEVEVAGDEAEVEVGQLVFSNLLASKLKPNLLNVRVGKFVPEFVPNSHRQFEKPWLATKSVGNNQWQLLRTQKGIEVNGVVGGRTVYDVGVVEGRKNLPNTAKDVYAHVGYKIGGLRPDGVVPEGESPATKNPRPWVDNSLTLDAFGYLGFADLPSTGAVPTGDEADEEASAEEAAAPAQLGSSPLRDNFTMFGGSANFFYENLNVTGTVALRHEDQLTAGGDSVNALYTMAEASYVIYPWLVPVVRIETFGLDTEGAGTDLRVLPMLRVLIRPNVQLSVLAELEKEAGDADSDESGASLELGEVEFGLTAGF